MTRPGPAAPAWLRYFGLRYNPFEYYEASRDPYLADYLVGHEVFVSAWMQAPSMIMAPAGGGKTATRIYTAQNCWNSVRSLQPLPVTYKPAMGSMASSATPMDVHYAALLDAIARTLLVGLLADPDRLLERPRALQEQVCHFLNARLPNSVDFYREALQGSSTLLPLRPYLQLDSVPPALGTGEKVRTLARLLSYEGDAPSWTMDAQETFMWLTALLTTHMQYRSLFLLVDGVDALPESGESPAAAVSWLQGLIENASAWADRRIFCKFFLPAEYTPWLQPHMDKFAFPVARIEWRPVDLATVLRRRIHMASNGMFDSLSAVSSPDLRNFEEQVCTRVERLPREAIMFMDHLLQQAASNHLPSPISLAAQDFEAAATWYETQRPAIVLA